MITEKGFPHVFETARKIAKQYQPGSQPVSNPAGHFKFLVMKGMEAPKGYTSKEEENRKKHEEAKREKKKCKDTNRTQDDGPSLEEVRNFVNQLRIGAIKDISQIGGRNQSGGDLE